MNDVKQMAVEVMNELHRTIPYDAYCTVMDGLQDIEVLRARRPGYPRPLLVHDRSSGGCGYSIDERDLKVYRGWKRNRANRGLDPDWPTEEERKAYWNEIY